MPDGKVLPSKHKGAQSYELAVQWSMEENTPAQIEKNLETLNTAIKLAAGDVDQLFQLRDQAEWYQEAARVANKVMDVGNAFMEANALVRKAEWAIAQEPLKQPGPQAVRYPRVTNSDNEPDSGAVRKKRHMIHAAYKGMAYDDLTEMLEARKPGVELRRKDIEESLRRQETVARRQARRAQLASLGKQARADENWAVVAKKIEEFEEYLDRNKVKADAIFTDPPYRREDLECWNLLGDFASRVLKPHGILIALSGTDHLPQVYARMEGHKNLTYLETAGFAFDPGAIGQPASHQALYKKAWKPILLYGRNDWVSYGNNALNFVKAPPLPKDDDRYDRFEWAQAVPTMTAILKQYTAGMPADMMVVDPYCGTGTNGIAALELKYQFRGSDHSSARAEQARGFIKEWMDG